MTGAAIVHCSSSWASSALLVGHLGELRHKLLVQPFKNLLGAEFWLTQSHDVGRQCVQRQVGNADFFAHAGSPPFIRTSYSQFRSRMAAKKPSVPVLWGKNSVPSGVMSAPGTAVFGSTT